MSFTNRYLFDYHIVQLNITLFFACNLKFDSGGLLSCYDSLLEIFEDSLDSFIEEFLFKIDCFFPNFKVFSGTLIVSDIPSFFFKSSVITILELPKILWELASLSESLSAAYFPYGCSIEFLFLWWSILPSIFPKSID